MRPLLRQLKSAPALVPGALPDSLRGIDFVLVERAVMAKVHGDFLNDATETDVITFPYGEILICPAVAREQAARRGLPVEREVLLYALHGLLHLTGYDDTTPRSARKMALAQEKLLRRVLAGTA